MSEVELSKNRVRSFRAPDVVWDTAMKRAKKEGVTLSGAIVGLLDGYAQGYYNLPKTRTTHRFPSNLRNP